MSNNDDDLLTLNPEASEKIKTMAATAAVLTTYELLENIILQLSPEDIFIAQHVGRAWRKIIIESPSVKTRRCIHPLVPHDFEVLSASDGRFAMVAIQNGQKYMVKDLHIQQTPAYSHNVKINSVLGSMKTNFAAKRTMHQNPKRTGPTPLIAIMVKLPRLSKPMVDKTHQFATEPRVTTMCLELTDTVGVTLSGLFDRRHNIASCCSIRVPTGITVGHVLEARDSMLEAEVRYYPQIKREQDTARPCNAYIMHTVDKDRIIVIKPMAQPWDRY